MNFEQYNCLLHTMIALAIIVFVCLYFIKAGYGLFRTKQWGWSLNNKLAWILMEAPAFIVMLIMWWQSGMNTHIPEIVFCGMFMLHYFQRSFIFPFLMKGTSKMPVAIMLMGVIFNTINGLMLGCGLFDFPNKDFACGAAYMYRPNAILGIVIFFAGMMINLHSDHVIRHLRKPGDTKHYLPQKGMYKYVTSGNYFGELTEWTGLAIATMLPAAWVFVIWTAANLVPRAHAIHKHYREEFGNDAVGNRKRIIPFVY